ncbi:MAG: hypothetical protein EPN82_14030 [Bacteroidetes bacterium]|nr:MAG: hypothetical protein EPN82_14030 [Bacteroidota bacterium]
MKKLAFYLLTILMFSIQVIAQWEPCNNGLLSGEISCFLKDGNNIYTGIDGGVYMTTGNGNNWIPKNKGLTTIPIPDTAIGSLAINENYIFASTDIEGIFRSTDKGENWVQNSNGVYFIVAQNNQYTYSKSFVVLR